MATTYNELRSKVLDWSNRDLEVFGSTTVAMGETYSPAQQRINDFIRYAADKCYRHLRVPSLEFSRIFTVAQEDIQVDPANLGWVTINMPVPVDLIEVIHIRNVTQHYVVDEKLDMRTYYQRDANKTTGCYWTRQGNTFKVTGLISIDDEFELHYYRRLPALDATYTVTAATYNIDNDLFTTPVLSDDQTTVSQPNVLWFPTGTTIVADVVTFTDSEADNTAVDSRTATKTVGITFTGTEADNWLRDENERILLFGALSELFAYVAEDDMLQKYATIFSQEIQELNQEEAMRMASGGNVKINYNSRLI